jgi:putative lipoprotein
LKCKILTAGLWGLCLSLLSACSLAEDVTDEGSKQLIGRTWVAEELSGRPTADGITSTLVVSEDGRVSGQAGCNGYFGSVIIDGAGMSFGNLGATRKACPEPMMVQEGSLLAALDNTRGYRLEAGDLLLLGGTGDVLARFVESTG